MSRLDLSGSESDLGTVELDFSSAPDRMASLMPEDARQRGPPGNFDFQGMGSSVRVVPARPRPERESRDLGDVRHDRHTSTRGRSPGSTSPLPFLDGGAPRYDGPPQGTWADLNDSPGRGLANLADNPERSTGGTSNRLNFPPVPPNLFLETPQDGNQSPRVQTLSAAAKDLNQSTDGPGRDDVAAPLTDANRDGPPRGISSGWIKPTSDRFGEWWFTANTLGVREPRSPGKRPLSPYMGGATTQPGVCRKPGWPGSGLHSEWAPAH